MPDKIDKKHRSWVMGRIRSSDTKPELIVRGLLHSCGYRFSLRRKDLPGNPDIALPKYKTAIFVHGCFWHWHRAPDCPISKIPKSNTPFWEAKLARNSQRDEENKAQLSSQGWHVVTVWECEVEKDLEVLLERLLAELEQQGGQPVGVARGKHIELKKIQAGALARHRAGLRKKAGPEKYEDDENP